MKKIGIIGAMDIEVKELINSMDNIKKETISNIDFYEGTLQGKNVVVAECGVGKVHRRFAVFLSLYAEFVGGSCGPDQISGGTLSFGTI